MARLSLNIGLHNLGHKQLDVDSENYTSSFLQGWTTIVYREGGFRSIDISCLTPRSLLEQQFGAGRHFGAGWGASRRER
jgi:hypothetical protein